MVRPENKSMVILGIVVCFLFGLNGMPILLLPGLMLVAKLFN